MNLATFIPNFHWIPVIVMTIVSFALGAVWHQKFLFGKTLTDENKSKLDKNMNMMSLLLLSELYLLSK
ncbi:MAG: hypothetical protein JZU47_01550 [Prolixibacteraceae bacterium]|nr:hypothetical protein [Prolixibacteraceae bacterium]